MSQKNPSLNELTTLVEGIVSQVLNKSFGGQMSTWASNNPRTSWHLSRETGDRNRVSGADQVFGGMGQIASSANFINNNEALRKSLRLNKDGFEKFGNGISGLVGIYGAYKSGDALGGAMSGWQLGASLGAKFGPWGAAVGLLAGLFSKGVDRWQRPKFKDSKQAFDKLFTMDRGERNDYYMPDSFYFRGGSQGARKITVHVGNDQFDNHIRESLTNNYAAQLQRGLVF